MTNKESKGINPQGESYEMRGKLRDDRKQKDVNL